MILVFDSETTGFNQTSLPHDHPSQPDLVQLGAVLCEPDGVERASLELIVRPDGYVIPKAAADVHGITTEIAGGCGVPLVMAVACFAQLAKLADTVVAHNLPFDERIMATACARAKRPMELPMKRVCTMELADLVLRLPPTERMRATGFGNKTKKPNLGECYRYFFHEELVGAHSALADARACARVYFQVVLRGGMRREQSLWERVGGWLR